MPYRKQIRRSKEDIEDELDIPENHYVETIDFWWDNIMHEWVMDCLIQEQTEWRSKQ